MSVLSASITGFLMENGLVISYINGITKLGDRKETESLNVEKSVDIERLTPAEILANAKR